MSYRESPSRDDDEREAVFEQEDTQESIEEEGEKFLRAMYDDVCRPDGLLSIAEFDDLWAKIEFPRTPYHQQNIRSMFEEVDQDNDGLISYKSFLDMIPRIAEFANRIQDPEYAAFHQHLKEVYNQVDQSKTGEVSIHNMTVFLASQGVNYIDDLNRSFEACDANKDGNITFQEFETSLRPYYDEDRNLFGHIRIFSQSTPARDSSSSLGAKSTIRGQFQPFPNVNEESLNKTSEIMFDKYESDPSPRSHNERRGTILSMDEPIEDMNPAIDDEKMEKLRQLFDELDVEKKGYVTYENLSSHIPPDAPHMFGKFERGNSRIAFDDFIHEFQTNVQQQTSPVPSPMTTRRRASFGRPGSPSAGHRKRVEAIGLTTLRGELNDMKAQLLSKQTENDHLKHQLAQLNRQIGDITRDADEQMTNEAVKSDLERGKIKSEAAKEVAQTKKLWAEDRARLNEKLAMAEKFLDEERSQTLENFEKIKDLEGDNKILRDERIKLNDELRRLEEKANQLDRHTDLIGRLEDEREDYRKKFQESEALLEESQVELAQSQRKLISLRESYDELTERYRQLSDRDKFNQAPIFSGPNMADELQKPLDSVLADLQYQNQELKSDLEKKMSLLSELQSKYDESCKENSALAHRNKSLLSEKHDAAVRNAQLEASAKELKDQLDSITSRYYDAVRKLQEQEQEKAAQEREFKRLKHLYDSDLLKLQQTTPEPPRIERDDHEQLLQENKRLHDTIEAWKRLFLELKNKFHGREQSRQESFEQLRNMYHDTKSLYEETKKLCEQQVKSIDTLEFALKAKDIQIKDMSAANAHLESRLKHTQQNIDAKGTHLKQSQNGDKVIASSMIPPLDMTVEGSYSQIEKLQQVCAELNKLLDLTQADWKSKNASLQAKLESQASSHARELSEKKEMELAALRKQFQRIDELEDQVRSLQAEINDLEAQLSKQHVSHSQTIRKDASSRKSRNKKILEAYLNQQANAHARQSMSPTKSTLPLDPTPSSAQLPDLPEPQRKEPGELQLVHIQKQAPKFHQLPITATGGRSALSALKQQEREKINALMRISAVLQKQNPHYVPSPSHVPPPNLNNNNNGMLSSPPRALRRDRSKLLSSVSSVPPHGSSNAAQLKNMYNDRLMMIEGILSKAETK